MSKKERKNNNPLAKADTLGKTRRSIWYILRFILIVAVVVILCYAAFMEALCISNCYIIVTEGMALRADCILNDGDVSLLDDYFTEEEQLVDTELFLGKYDAFYVESYNYDIDIEGFEVYPWSTRVTFTIMETVTQIIASAYNDGDESTVPEWTNARYELELEKMDGKWLISRKTLLEEDPEIEPPHTPDYSKLDQTP